MRVNIENASAHGSPGTKSWVLEELVRNLKELRDRTDAGDMTALNEFFGLFVFNDNQLDDRAKEGRCRMTTPQLTHCPHCGERIAPEPKRRIWSPDEDQSLRDMLRASRDVLDIADALGRPVSSIKSRIQTLAKNNALLAPPTRSRVDDDAASVTLETPPSSITSLPGVRIITHRIRG